MLYNLILILTFALHFRNRFYFCCFFTFRILIEEVTHKVDSCKSLSGFETLIFVCLLLCRSLGPCLNGQ